MCEDERTRGGLGTAEAAHCDNGGKGAGGFCSGSGVVVGVRGGGSR